MQKLLVRSLSGIVYVVLILAAIFAGAVWVHALASLFAVLAVVEFEKILDRGHPQGWAQWAWRVFDVIVALAVVNLAGILYAPQWLVALMVVIVLIATLVRFTLGLYDKSQAAFTSVAWSALAWLYIAVPLACLTALYVQPGGRTIVLVMFVMIWLNDTGAFCVGSLLGRHRLFERLSPKKSWEGFFGGLACDVLAGVGAFYLFPEAGRPLWMWMVIGAVVSVLSTWGDLFESLMKRSNHIKDSGNLIPGHGGILDRIDSLLFVAVGLWVLDAIVISF